MSIRVCYRVNAKDADGNPYDFGISVEQDDVALKDGVTYEQLGQHIKKQNIINAVCLSDHITPEQMELITPEEYDRLYDSIEEDDEADA